MYACTRREEQSLQQILVKYPMLPDMLRKKTFLSPFAHSLPALCQTGYFLTLLGHRYGTTIRR